MKTIPYNIHWQVGFKILPTGQTALKNYYDSLKINVPNLEQDERGYTWMLMADFMEIFGGKYITDYYKGHELPFETVLLLKVPE